MSKHKLDVLIVAANARSLVANRGDLIQALKVRGLRVGALVPQADYRDNVKDLGIPIQTFALTRTGTNPLADLRSLAQLTRLIRSANPRVVFSYSIKPVIYGTIAAALAGIRGRYAMITGLGHAYTTDSGRTSALRKITDRLYRLALGLATKVFFQNPDDLAELTARGVLADPEKAVLVNGSGVNLERFPARLLPKGDPHFLFIGRLLTEKGVAEFVEAAREVHRDYPRARFTAVGGHAADLPHSVAAEDLERWKDQGIVDFVGEVSDVRPWLENCSVFVLPSYREGTPRSVLEAMATGRAVITSDAPGCRETVDPGVNGYLVPVKDAGALASAMRAYLENPELIAAHGEAGLALARDKYDVNKVNAVLLGAMGFSA